jgi:dethiobiotin synthetase
VTRACFVSATGTGVGKTVLAAAIAAALVADGVAVSARKPVATGVGYGRQPGGEDLAGLDDHELLAAVTGERPEDVAPARYAAAVAPHLAAEMSGVDLDVIAIVAGLRERAASAPALIVEGIGGLLVPLALDWDVRALARELGWPLLVAASPGLGTINHTLLTLEAARAGGIEVSAVVLTPWPADPGLLERSNRATIERLGEVEVATLPALDEITRASLADAARALPYERWLDG